jgi:hypothetical protein
LWLYEVEMPEKLDGLLQAIKTVYATLEPLSPEARGNVLDFVFRELGMVGEAKRFPPQGPAAAMPGEAASRERAFPAQGAVMDLRTLAADKKPKTVLQKVALVAYYLANHAPADERRDYIVAADIKRYFKQAGFPLPTAKDSVTLVNAKNAGYLDGMQGGQYRLNPVGHNLVAHKLSSPDETEAKLRRGKARGTKKRPARGK